jgi:uncharacterized protein YbaR (Trm112 family)
LTNDRLIREDLLEIMQCPRDGGALREDFDASQLVCVTCGVRYPVRTGIPIMLVEEAIHPQSGKKAWWRELSARIRHR